MAALWLVSGFAIFAGIAMLPVIIVVGVCILIITLVIRYWDEIVAFFEAAYAAGAALLSSIGTYIGNKWDDFWTSVDSAWTSAGEFFGGIASWFAGIPAAIGTWFGNTKDKVVAGALRVRKGFTDAVASFFSYIDKKWQVIKAAPGKLLTAILNLVKLPINGLSDLWNSRIKHIIPEMSIPDWVPAIGGKSFGPFPGEMKYFADGGLVNSPTLGMIGEAGPEAVIPLRGGNVPVRLSGQQYSDRTMKEMIRAVSAAVAQHGNTFNINIDVSGLLATSDQAKREFAKDISEEIQQNILRNMVGLNKNPTTTIGSWF
jgi:hypothetical protein